MDGDFRRRDIAQLFQHFDLPKLLPMTEDHGGA
jgi:hypothetical protein